MIALQQFTHVCMPPEPDGETSQTADVWALGCLLYTLLVRRAVSTLGSFFGICVPLLSAIQGHLCRKWGVNQAETLCVPADKSIHVHLQQVLL